MSARAIAQTILEELGRKKNPPYIIFFSNVSKIKRYQKTTTQKLRILRKVEKWNKRHKTNFHSRQRSLFLGSTMYPSANWRAICRQNCRCGQIHLQPRIKPRWPQTRGHNMPYVKTSSYRWIIRNIFVRWSSVKK